MNRLPDMIGFKITPLGLFLTSSLILRAFSSDKQIEIISGILTERIFQQ